MLKLANDYEEELRRLLREASLDYRYMYYFSGPGGNGSDRLGDDTIWARNFVSVDKDGKLIGYIAYSVDAYAERAYGFGFISFDIGNTTFIRDARIVVSDIFEKYNLNSMSWHGYADNPVMGSYERLCKKMGGRQCGFERQVAKLLDGKLHDSISFEVLREEYFRSDFYRSMCRSRGNEQKRRSESH